MLRQLLPLIFLAPLYVIAQEVERIDHYLPGTRISYFIGQCGEDVPEADGRLSFCDGAGNLGVVMESLGLSGRGVLRMLPNYFNDSEVYVTRGGISIRHTDGSWENVPALAAAVRNFQGEITNEGQIETGLVDADGLLHFNITSTSRRLYYTYDLRTKEIVQVPVSNTQGTQAFAYDVDADLVYILASSFRDHRIFRRDGDGTVGEVKRLDDLTVTSINATTFTFHDGRLWIGNTQGLSIIDPADDFAITPLDAENGKLPLDEVNDIEFAADGTVWLAQSGPNRGALVQLDQSDTTFTEYVLLDPGNANNIELRWEDLALLDDGRITAVAINFFGYVDLDPTGNTPEWTTVGRGSLDALDLFITYSPPTVERHAGRTYYLTNDFSTSNTDRAEVLIRDANDNFETRNDDRPANYSYWEVDRFNGMHADREGGVYLYSHFDNIISYVSPDEGIRSRTFPNLPSIEPAVDGEGRLAYLGRDTDNRSAWQLLDWPFDRAIAGVPTSNVLVTAYGSTVAFFSKNSGEYIRTVNGRVVARDTLPEANTYGDFFQLAVGDGGIVWLAGQDRGQGMQIVRFDPATGELRRYVPGRSTGNPRRVVVGPEGTAYFIAQRGLVYYDGSDYYVHTSEDFEELRTVHDAAVDTLGRFFLLTDTRGTVHQVGNLNASPSFATRRVGELLPFIDGRASQIMALDADGDLWVSGFGGLFQLTDDRTAPAYWPRGNDYLLEGRVYADLNDNGRYDEGEGLPNQPVAITTNGTTRMRLTNDDGRYVTLLRDENTEYRVTLTTLERIFYAADRQESVAVTAADRDYSVPDFRLEVKDYNSLYFQTANKLGAWGFEREGFDNVFTTAVTNLSTTKTFRELDISFVYFNQEPGTGNQLPNVTNVRATRLTPTGVPLLVNNIVIQPRNHAWYVTGVTPDRYERGLVSLTPDITNAPDTVTTTIRLDALAPRETVVFSIETERFQASSNGVVIGYSPSRTKSPDLDGGNDNVNENVVIIYPEPENDGPQPAFDPFSDPNSPYVSPDEIYEDPPYQEPEEVYAPPPYETPIFSSYDPNDKLVDGGVATKTNDTELDRKWLTYTIRFENTGNFSAKDVWIIDTLDTQFVPGSLTLLGASHDVEVDYLESDTLTVLRFSLEDIYLPFQDSINDGYVRFALRAAEDVDVGDIVRNGAAIYFDQNPPIITNVVENRFVEVMTSLARTPVQIELEAFPNPASETISIRTPHRIQNSQLFDAAGRLVGDYGATTRLDLRRVPSGVFLLRVATDAGVGVKRVVVR